jgi:hypothetical protein
VVPWGLLTIASGLAGIMAMSGLATPGVSARSAEAIAAFGGVAFLLAMLSGLLFLLLHELITVVTVDFLQSTPSTLWSVYRRALARLLPAIGAGVLVLLGALILLALSIPVWLVTLGPLGMLVALVAVLIWWGNPAARKPWTKWLIILTTPAGLLFYYTVRWSLFVPVVVLERLGPLAALQRSGELVSGSWFRVLGVLVVMSIIVQILTGLVSGVVSLGLYFLPSIGPASSFLGSVGGILGQIVFGATLYIAYTLLFLDLRNRREGTDIAERLALLESAASST